MDDDSQKLERLVKENLRLTKENNRRLRSIQRGMFLGGVIRLLVWAVLLGLPILIYFSVVKPYVDDARNTFEDITTGQTSVFEQLFQIPGINVFEAPLQEHQVEGE